MRGDCVAWNPEMAPQDTTMKRKGKMLLVAASGWKLIRVAGVSSIRFRLPPAHFTVILMKTPRAMKIRAPPKKG